MKLDGATWTKKRVEYGKISRERIEAKDQMKWEVGVELVEVVAVVAVTFLDTLGSLSLPR
jgi:hypothetical protein